MVGQCALAAVVNGRRTDSEHSELTIAPSPDRAAAADARLAATEHAPGAQLESDDALVAAPVNVPALLPLLLVARDERRNAGSR